MNTCNLCFHHCQMEEGQIGFCKARMCISDQIICRNYGHITALALDPIEKKPLAHFYPGSKILSLGSYGCNLRCSFCQNHEISMKDRHEHSKYITAQEAVDLAKAYQKYGNIGLAYTYNEPLVSLEFVRDCARLAHQADLKNVLVSNGCFTIEAIQELLPYIDAMNIDVKGFQDSFYQSIAGNLESVKEMLAYCVKKTHVEVTTLIIPEENDRISDMQKEAKWLASLDPDIVLHITRFFPQYQKRNKKPTKLETLKQLQEEAKKYLHYVYLGNI